MNNNFTLIPNKIDNYQENKEFAPKLSQPFLNKYEKTSLISLRLEQLANNSHTTLNEEERKDCKNIYDIVDNEYKLKKIPLKICRTLPNNKKEIITLDQLQDYNI